MTGCHMQMQGVAVVQDKQQGVFVIVVKVSGTNHIYIQDGAVQARGGVKESYCWK